MTWLLILDHASASNYPPWFIASYATGAQFRTEAAGRPGKVYRVYVAEALTNGVAWTNVDTFTASTTNFGFTDTGYANLTQRFYRLSMLPATNPPSWPGGGQLSFTVPDSNSVRLSWPGATDLLDIVQYAVYQDGVLITNLAGTSRTFSVSGLASGTSHTFSVQAMNEDTNWTVNGPQVAVNPAPPNPEDVAPRMENRSAALMKPSTAFLYTNSNPIQTGVATNTIDDTRAAVIRGTVSATDGSALPGVVVTVLNHNEYGQTVTRTNGEYDLAVNGGAALTLVYRKDGYMTIERTAPATWQEYQVADYVVLTPLDTNVSVVIFPSNGVQIAQGSRVVDGSGHRRFTLLFPPGTEAEMVLQDNTTQSLSTAHVRITEVTIGSNGLNAMQADLPPETEYTYAAEYTADEAEAADAKTVQFRPDIYGYMTNFIGMPVGVPVPQGWLDKETATWIPDEDGRVIRFVAVSNGMAEVDVNGDGLVEDTNVLAAMGFTDVERQELVDLYTPGWELWRVPMAHFSDLNYGIGSGGQGWYPVNPMMTGNNQTPYANYQGGYGTVEIQNQVFQEDVPVVGTPFTLHYASDRARGYTAGYILDIPIISTSIPSLQGIKLEIEVAGREFEETFAATTNLTYTFQWDGKDAYGRTLQGKQPLTYRIGYQYTGYYMRPPTNLSATFAGASGEYITNPVTGERVPTRQLQTLWQEETTEIGRWDMSDYSLGGWMLSVHHVFDPIGGIVYLGNGRRQDINGPSDGVMMNLAGTGTNGFSGDGGQGTSAEMNNPGGTAVAPDGTIYVADTENNRIRRIVGGDSNTIVTVVGTGAAGFGGDGGAGTNAQVNSPRGMTVDRSGNLYFADSGNNRVRKLDTNGVVTTVAGTGTAGFGGDNGLAINAQLNDPRGVAITRDGTLYIADTENNRVRKVGTDGIVATVAGTGTAGLSGDGGSGQQAQLNKPSGVGVDAQGRVFIADTENDSVRQLNRDGTILTYAGTGSAGYGGDGGAASLSQLSSPSSVSVGRGSTLYIADSSNSCVRRISGQQTINTYGGNGTSGYSGNGAPTQQAQMNSPQSVSVGPDGRAYVADTQNGAARRMGSQVTPAQQAEMLVASEDGSVVYVFGRDGQHVGTKHALTGESLYLFQYDTAKRLIGILDRNNKLTRILRDGDGKPTGIQAPYGQVTTLNVDTNGDLTRVVTPASETNQYTYNSNGLLATVTGPRGYTYSIAYDARSYVTSASDPSGGTSTFSRLAGVDAREITRTSALGRVTGYSVSNRSDNAEVQVRSYPDGTWSRTVTFSDAVISNRTAAGELSRTVESPDPRFGMQAPWVSEFVLRTPGGLEFSTIHRRAVMRSDPRGIFPIQAQRDETVVNGRTNVVFYDATTRVSTVFSPMGRHSTNVIDIMGRVLQSASFDWAPVSYLYNSNGQIAAVSMGSGPGLRATKYGYNASGWIDAVTNALNQVTRSSYDSAGRATNVLWANGQSVASTFDGEGHRTSVTPPGRAAHTFGYTPVGLVSEYIPPVIGATTNKVSYSWDKERQPAGVTRADFSTIGYTYNSSGQLTEVGMPSKAIRFAYNANGQIASITVTNEGVVVSNEYDGRLPLSASLAGPVTGKVARTLDNNFWVTAVSINGSTTISNSYDADGFLTAVGDLSITRHPLNGSVVTAVLGAFTNSYAYNVFGELVHAAVYYKGTNIYSAEQARDNLGRITNRIEIVAGIGQTNEFQYDPVGQLVHMIKPGMPSYDYFYDANGNRTNLLRPDGPPQRGTYDAQDRLTQYGSNTYAWSADGELTNKTTNAVSTSYTYDEQGHLRAVTLPGGTNIEYVLDGLGRRVGKRVGGVLRQGFLYGGLLKPVAELDGSNGIVNIFVYGTRASVPDYMVRSGVTYRIVFDHLGSPRLVVNADTGAILQRMDYDEFGRVTQDTHPGFQPFGFAGGLYDPDTRLVHLGAREYDAETGRWTSRDPVLFGGNSPNLFGYCHNDPVNLTDSTGRGPGWTWNSEGAQLAGNLPPVHPFFTVFSVLATYDTGNQLYQANLEGDSMESYHQTWNLYASGMSYFGPIGYVGSLVMQAEGNAMFEGAQTPSTPEQIQGASQGSDNTEHWGSMK